MKLSKILMALAAMAMVGCSSEDVNDFTANQAIEDSNLIQLDPNFVLAGVGGEDATTRTHWEMVGGALKNKFLPIWATAPAGGNTIDADAALEAQAVGLCWLGNGAVGTDVYTNYEFYHFGWLKAGETEAKFECNQLTNGAFYDEITVAAGDAAGAEADETNFTLPAAPINKTTWTLNYNSGIYKTDNKAIFGGQYIVYYPYNPEFKNAGTIPATAATKFNPVATAFTAPEVGHATFRYSAPVTIEGGAKASDFGLYNLSALVQLRVAGPTGVNIGKNIDQIVLYSAKKQLLAQANLAADQIAAGKGGADLYTTTEGTKTISATFGAPVAVQATNAAPTSAYITVLPTTVEDLVVLVHSTDGKWAKVNKPNTVFEAGTAKRVDIEVKAADFKTDYIAVDEPTLITARNEARAAGGSKTVTVIGDIVLDGTTADVLGTPATYDFFSNGNDKNITYKGDAIIVPEDIIFQVGTKIQSDLRVLGKSCCTGTLGARLEIYNNAVLNNVTVEETEANVVDALTYNNYNPLVTYVNGTAEIAAGKTFDVKAGRVIVNSAVKHKGDLNLAAKVSLTVNATGDLNFMGGSVVNNGTIEVQKDGQYDMTDANGNATASDGQRMTNNGKFIHNVDAQVGTAVQSMAQNGEYRCRVDKQIKLDDALLQWTACSVIEMVNTVAENYNLGTGASIHLLDPSFADYKHNGKYIDYEVNAGALTTFTNPANGAGNGDSKVIEVGKLSVLAGGLNVDYVTGTGKRTLTVHGDMEVKATTTFVDSKLIELKKNLNVSGAGVTLLYKGAKKNEDGLKVAGNITVTRGTFDAGNAAADVNALNIECANFKLKSGAKAYFGNRTEGDAKNMTVTGEISNPSGCTFDIKAANQDGNGSVYAWITCTKLTVGGSFPNARPKVVE